MMLGRKPSLHGCNPRVMLSKEQCVKFKISEAFADVIIKDWCDEKLMAKKFVVTLGSESTYQDALQTIKVSLNVISMKQKSLTKYCKSAIKYFKTKNVVSSFKETYDLEREEYKIQQLKLKLSRKWCRNALAVTLEEHDQYLQEIALTTSSDSHDSGTKETADFTPGGSAFTQETAEFTSGGSAFFHETADFTPEDSIITADSKPEASGITQETAYLTPEDSNTTQESSDFSFEDTDRSTLLSFRTEVFKAGYKYFKSASSQIRDMYKSNKSPAKRSISPGVFFTPKRKQQKKN